jgi:hypothetical protein
VSQAPRVVGDRVLGVELRVFVGIDLGSIEGRRRRAIHPREPLRTPRARVVGGPGCIEPNDDRAHSSGADTLRDGSPRPNRNRSTAGAQSFSAFTVNRLCPSLPMAGRRSRLAGAPAPV